jgi:carbamate kinase
MTAAEAEQYIAEGHFAAGSMLPKVQAAVSFVKTAPLPADSGAAQERSALITLLTKAKDGIAGKTGTRITL